ncbi:MAG TPA: helix-turn-helix transcriptional regulator [Kineosporiaceae bacterium]
MTASTGNAYSRPMPLLRGAIGVVLRRARRHQGKTLKDVADTARISVQYLSEVERGRKEASSEVLSAVITALGWTIVDLLDAVREELAPIPRVEVTGFALPAGLAADVPGREPACQAAPQAPQASVMVRVAA